MAQFLYRLGSLAYERRKAVVAIWLVILLAVGGLAGAFMGKLSNTFTIPGTETERVMELMEQELPELASGTGTLVFVTQDGKPFTEEQRAAVQAAVQKIDSLDSVRFITDPFEMQDDLDSAATQLADGEAEIAANELLLEEGADQIAQGRLQIADAKRQMDEGAAEIAANEPTLIAGRIALEAGRIQLINAGAALAAGKATLDAGAAELESGRRQLAAGEVEYTAGQAQIAQGQAQVDAGRATLAEEQTKIDEFDAGVAELTEGLGVSTLSEVPAAIDAAQAQIDAGRAEAEAGRDQAQAGIDALAPLIEDAQIAVAQIESQLEALDPEAPGYEAQKAALEAALQVASGGLTLLESKLTEAKEGLALAEAGLAQLDAAQSALDAASAGYQALSAAAPAVDQGRLQIAAAKQQLDAAQAELDAGRVAAAAGRAELDSATAQIQVGQAELAAGIAEYESGLAQYQSGLAELNANEVLLAEGEAELAAGKLQLEEGRQQIADSESELEDGEAELKEGRIALEDGKLQLERGARLAAVSANMQFVSQDDTAAVAQISFMGQTMALKDADRQELFAAVEDLPALGVDALYSSEITSDLNSVIGISEVIGFLIAGVVLLFVLGTLLAAGLPLLVALFGVAIGVGVTLSLSTVIDMQSITPVLALMLGLAVGIDYSLFIVHRHRTQMLAGMPVQDSIAKAIATSGSAVVFAGLTVVIALSALVVPRLPFLSILGLSAAFTVLVVVLLSITLTPALLGFMGEKVLTKKGHAQREQAIAAIGRGEGGGAGATSAVATADGQHKASRWWARVVTKNSWVAAGAVVVILGTLAIPAAYMQTALPDGGSEPEGSDALQAFEVTSAQFGEGYNGPLLVMGKLPEGLSQEEADDVLVSVAEEISIFEGVVAAVPAMTNDSLTYGALQVIPEGGPSSPATEDLVHHIRDAKGDVLASTGVETDVTGMVAAQIDVSELISAALAPYLVIVVGLSLVLLLLVFRSLAVPLLATVGFLLSLAAAFGVAVAVYQWGWFGALFGVHNPGPILSFLPILLTGILFGLAMDYQVFLVTAMREAYVETGQARRSVRTGFAMAAPVVVAAALIMVSVFAGFIFSGLAMIRPLGFGLAMGVLFDAFLVRMTFVPAVMQILGDKAWYLPKWLSRILPKVDVEGAELG